MMYLYERNVLAENVKQYKKYILISLYGIKMIDVSDLCPFATVLLIYFLNSSHKSIPIFNSKKMLSWMRIVIIL